MWPDKRLLDLFRIELPIVQAPMAGASGTSIALAAADAGGLGSLPCAMLDPATARRDLETFRQHSSKPVNVNFFCHDPVAPDTEQDRRWQQHLSPYYSEFGLDPQTDIASVNRAPFNEEMCQLVEALKPEVVSFHFGLPAPSLVARVKAAGCRVISSATTVNEARWLEQHGCDAIIAQGVEAGGHRGMFLTGEITTQMGTLALVPQVVDAVSIPVLAAGGIADGRAIAAAFMLGASGVQIGTAYLFTPESLVSALHREALLGAANNHTALTNVFSGRPARGLMNRVMQEIGPLSPLAPHFPTAGAALGPLKKQAEAAGDAGFSSLWSGQGAAMVRRDGRQMGAAALTRWLAEEARQCLAGATESASDQPVQALEEPVLNSE